MLLAETGGVEPAVGQVRALGRAGPAVGPLDRFARVGHDLGQPGAHSSQRLVQSSRAGAGRVAFPEQRRRVRFRGFGALAHLQGARYQEINIF